MQKITIRKSEKINKIKFDNSIIVFYSLKKKKITFWSIERKTIDLNSESMSKRIVFGFVIAKIDSLKQTQK